MLRSILRGGDIRSAIIQMILLIPIILISLSVHECAHAYTAHLLGDDTARNYGRITLDPRKHIDPFGLLMLFVCGFGWAKPVPVITRNMKHARWDFVIVSLAGPFSNLLLAILGCIVQNLVAVVFANLSTESAVVTAVFIYTYIFFQLFVTLNVGYAVFNMIPLPPLDGSRLVTALIPRRWAEFSFKYERYFQIVMFIFLYLGAFTNVISIAVSAVSDGIYNLVGLIPFELFIRG